MMHPRNRPILVTGTPRSGSTWVGYMIGRHPDVTNVFEPFNPEYPHPGSPVTGFFSYVTPETAPRFVAYLKPIVEFRPPPREPARARTLVRRLARLARGWRRVRGTRTLLKDPIAFFSAEWLADTFRADVVVLIRHPAAFVSSITRLGWRFDFDTLLGQPELVARYLGGLEPEVRTAHRAQAAGRLDLLDEAVLYWRIFHTVIRRYQVERPGWHFARHEDLSRDPLGAYGRLFRDVRLEMRNGVRRTLEAFTGPGNPADPGGPGAAHVLKRDSRANIWNWRDRLTPAEIDRVRRGTEDVAGHFYADADWEPGPVG